MTDLGTPTAPPPYAGPPRHVGEAVDPMVDPEKNIPVWIVVLVLALLLGLGGLAVLALTPDGPEPKAASYPDTWDRQVRPLVKIAEKQRGLRFQHPVEVRFLSSKRFERSVTRTRGELTSEDREELRQTAGLLRAFGLVGGNLDLAKALNRSTGGGTLAYYSFEDETITIRGKRLTPAVRSTLVHELTHALQDQHFAVGERLERLQKQEEKDDETTGSSVLRAVVEGDAQRVERLYRNTLPAKQRQALDSERDDVTTQAIARMKGVPKVVLALMSAPYALGEGLVQAVAVDGDNAAVDRLLQAPPAHESSLLDPFEVLANDTDAVAVKAPVLQNGEKKFDAGELGVLTWYLLLAERMPAAEALSVTDGWGGDAYVAFERDGVSCARMSYVGDTARDTARMQSALSRWVAVGPRSTAQVSRTGKHVLVESCDPGTSAVTGKDGSLDALTLVAARSSLGVGLLSAGLPESVSGCMADRLVEEYPVAQLTDPTFGADDPAVQARIQQLAIGCR